MTIDKAKVLLCQMYLPQFDEEEKQALTIAIEALEELKKAREGFNENRKTRCKHGYSDGYNKAMDDFAHKITKDIGKYIHGNYDLFDDFVEDIVQQLKVGNDNDK